MTPCIRVVRRIWIPSGFKLPAGDYFIREPVTTALLDRVIAGVQDSPQTPPAVREALI